MLVDMGFYVSLEWKQELMSELILFQAQPSFRPVTAGWRPLVGFTRLEANRRPLGFSGKRTGCKDCTAKISVMAKAGKHPEGN